MGLVSLFLLSAATIGGAVPALAIPVNIAIQNGNFNGTLNDGSGTQVNYSYSVIHDASQSIGNFAGGTYYDGGTDLFTGITGNLTGNLTGSPGAYTLSGIGGTLTSTLTTDGALKFGGTAGSTETFTITAGSSLTDVAGSTASGTLNYSLSGAFNGTGSFDFKPVAFLTGTTSPNSLSNSWLYLWGDNWNIANARPTDGSALGVDLSGKITPVPVPAAAVLFGTGLVGLAGAVRKKLRSI